MALMSMCARAAWRQDLDTGKSILATHAAANLMIDIDENGVRLRDPVLFAAEIATCETKELAEPKPASTSKRKKAVQKTLSRQEPGKQSCGSRSRKYFSLLAC